MRLAVIGVGLIGGSFALALKQAGKVSHVVGAGRSRANLELALERRTLARQSDIRLNRLAQMDEGSHDFDVHANRPRAAQDARKHRDALLGERVREVFYVLTAFQGHSL